MGCTKYFQHRFFTFVVVQSIQERLESIFDIYSFEFIFIDVELRHNAN